MLTIRSIIKSLCFLTMCFYRIWSFSGKNFEKNFFFRFLRKVTSNLILIWRTQYSNSFFQIFLFLFFFFPRLAKNVLKMGQNIFPTIFMKIDTYPNFDKENSKIEIVFPSFSIFIFVFASISQKCFERWIENFFLGFS